MAIIQTGSNTTGAANVDTGFNLKVNLGTDTSLMGGAINFSQNDEGTHTGIPYLKSPETSQDYRVRVGVDTVLFTDTFNATTQNTGLWKHAFTTMTMTQSAGFLNVNAAGTSTVSGNYASLQSWRYFPLVGTAPLALEFTFQIDRAMITNETFQCGLGIPGAGVDAPDGVWFEMTSSGLFGVIRYNSGTAVKQDLTTSIASLGTNMNKKFVIVVGEREVEYWLDDVLLGEQVIPGPQGQPFMTTALPIFIMKYNSGLVASSPNTIIKMGDITATLMDLGAMKPWAHQMAGAGLMAYQGQNGGTLIGTSVGVSAAPAAAAALVQASATAQFTGLGGVFRVLPTLTAGTDGLLMNFVNPAGGVNQTPRTLYVTGVKIYSLVEVALTGGPLVNVYELCYGATADTLATVADSASFATGTVKCHRRIPIGIEYYGAAAAAGNMPNTNGLTLDLANAPVVVNPGERLAIGIRNLGTVTTLGNLLISAAVTGYWE